MNFEELKELVNNRVGHIEERQNKYKKWAEVLKQLKVTGFTVVIVYDCSTSEDQNGIPIDIDHALIWKSSNYNTNENEDASRFYIANIEKHDDIMGKIYLFPITESKLFMREEFFSKINDDEVEKIIKNCLKMNPLGFHIINIVSETLINHGSQDYINRAIERYYDNKRNKSIKGMYKK